MFEELNKTTIMITGATGLIGRSIIERLKSLDCQIIAVVRNKEKAMDYFRDNKKIEYLISDITELEVKKYDLDYIIHAASITASKDFINDPIMVINTAIDGTKKTLEIAKLSNVKGYVYLSSMEVYGTPTTDQKISETYPSNLNTMMARSAYPESKRMCESLCASYASQYGVPTKVVRLTQTFGPGVQYNDTRVFAEFARCAIEGRDIVLHTKGKTKRSYLYTKDAVNAILTVLLKGEVSEAYNAANEDTYCSIFEMAELVANKCSNKKIKVVINETNISKYGYAPLLHMNLDTSKLRQLGWEAHIGLEDMFRHMIVQMKKMEGN